MPRVIEGNLVGDGFKVAIVVARFNATITGRLLEGALDGLKRHGVGEQNITVAHAPGSFEVPQVARRFVDGGAHDAVICLGAVVRGATDHYEHVAAAATQGVARLAYDSSIPVIFGILTCDTLEQAFERAGTKSGNKGFDAAVAAIEMANLLRQIGG
jgi:6,7-dimethyl-8-ribityllumazine synthase